MTAQARQILHIDMDAFFASVEQRENGALRGKPVIVGGASRRGVVCAASYEVRPYGVRSAMPMAVALRRCPHAIVVPPRHELYARVSADVFRILRRYTPLVEGLSVDEAFLDVTQSRSLFGDGRAIAEKIREDIRRELDLHASAGIAPSKFVAKIASDLGKPNGICVVEPDRVTEFLRPLPIERMWGVGAKTAEGLRAAGMRTFADLADADPAMLSRLLGTSGPRIGQLARGEDDRPVLPDREGKSISAEETFEYDLYDRDEIERVLLHHASRLAGRLLAEGKAARVVAVKLKYADFRVRSRQRRCDECMAHTDAIFRVARELLGAFPRDRKGVRLVGLGLRDFEGARQVELFPGTNDPRGMLLEVATAALRERFGSGAITRAALLPGPEDLTKASAEPSMAAERGHTGTAPSRGRSQPPET